MPVRSRVRWTRHVLLSLSISGLLLLVLEGARSVFKGDTPHRSLVVAAYSRVTGGPTRVHSPEAFPDLLTAESDVTDLLPALKDHGIILGNSPYYTLVTDDARITYRDSRGFVRMKPNLDYKLLYLRSRLHSAFDPIAVQVPTHIRLPERLEEFMNRFAFVSSRFTTDERGDRTTVPLIDADGVVLVLGDSVAFGTCLNDDETLASVLQRRSDRIRVLNSSVPGAGAADNIARLAERLDAFGRRVRGLIYVHCENDFEIERGVPKYSPAYIVDGLSHLLEEHQIEYRVLVYQQNMQTTMPEIARELDERDLLLYYRLKNRLVELAEARGFVTIDFYETVRRYCHDKGSLFAGMALYVDHVHLSYQGTVEIASRIQLER